MLARVMETTLSLYEVLLGLVLALAWYACRSKLMSEVAKVEIEMKEELAIQMHTLTDKIADNVQEQFDNMDEGIRDAVDFDPFEQIELFRASIMNNLLQMGVQWVGNKFGAELGVHQIEEPDSIEAPE